MSEVGVLEDARASGREKGAREYAVSRFSELAEDETLVVQFGKLAQLEILSD